MLRLLSTTTNNNYNNTNNAGGAAANNNVCDIESQAGIRPSLTECINRDLSCDLYPPSLVLLIINEELCGRLRHLHGNPQYMLGTKHIDTVVNIDAAI